MLDSWRHYIFIGLEIDARFLALLRGDRRRGVGQRVDAAAGLREGDHLANRVGTGQQLDDPVPAERDAAVRRGAKGERVQQESEFLLRLDSADAHHREHAFLDVAAMDTNGAAADLVTVAHDVVGVGERVTRIAVEGVFRLTLG